jgi:hypothetical protein
METMNPSKPVPTYQLTLEFNCPYLNDYKTFEEKLNHVIDHIIVKDYHNYVSNISEVKQE